MLKFERTKNATRNILFGMLLRFYQIIVPFLMRTAIIYFMGVEYLGLNSLFTSIVQVLNLTELGVGSAMVYSMYKPIAENDETVICALMQLYKKYYRVIGLIIGIMGIVLTPFIPRLIKGDVPGDMNIYILYLFNLTATVLSYLLFAYKNAILQAHQRIDVISKVTICTSTIQYVVQLLVICITKDYYLFVLVLLFSQVLTNIVTAIVADRFYPNFQPKGKLEKKEIANINNRIKDLFTAKLGSVIISSSDTIIISGFLGLTELAMYQNYYYILTAVIGVITVLFTSSMAGIGNSLIVESKEKNFNDLKKITFLVSWMAAICSCCFLGIFQPFMKLWVGEKYLLPFGVVICFALYFYIFEINQLLNLYKDAGGIWHEDRFRPLITGVVNVGINLLTVKSWGVFGVILSTVISMLFVGMPWLLNNLFDTLFERKDKIKYIINISKYTIVMIVSCILVILLCNVLKGGIFIEIFVRILVCIIIPVILYLFMFGKTIEFRQSIYLIDNMCNGKLHLKKLFRF